MTAFFCIWLVVGITFWFCGLFAWGISRKIEDNKDLEQQGLNLMAMSLAWIPIVLVMMGIFLYQVSMSIYNHCKEKLC